MRAVLAGIGGVLLSASAAFAQSAPTAAPAAPLTFLYAGGVDTWLRGTFGYGSFLWSPAGLDAEGFTFKAVGGVGRYLYRSGFLSTDAARADQTVVSLQPGWRFRGTGYEFLIVGGLDMQRHEPTVADRTARLNGTYVGARLGADLWLEPLRGFMLATNSSVSTIGESYSHRLASGVRIADFAWIGPEAQLLGDAHYTQRRYGVHITGVRTGAFEWAAGAGYAEDSERKHGAYVRLGVLTRR